MLYLLLNIEVFVKMLVRNTLAVYCLRDTGGKEFMSPLPLGLILITRMRAAFNLWRFLDAANLVWQASRWRPFQQSGRFLGKLGFIFSCSDFAEGEVAEACTLPPEISAKGTAALRAILSTLLTCGQIKDIGHNCANLAAEGLFAL